MAASSSPSAGTVQVWLYSAAFVRVVLVDLPVPLPAVVRYQGGFYAWSEIRGVYLFTTPFDAATTRLSNKEASHVADPVF